METFIVKIQFLQQTSFLNAMAMRMKTQILYLHTRIQCYNISLPLRESPYQTLQMVCIHHNFLNYLIVLCNSFYIICIHNLYFECSEF